MSIYEQNPGGLIAQPNRKVAVFDSGLIRVEQDFVCTTESADSNREILQVGNSFPKDTSPAFDGLFIFPSPQEIRTGDGLTRFMVSGYGRSTEKFISQRRDIKSTIIVSAYYETITTGANSISAQNFGIVSTNNLTGKISILENRLDYEDLNLESNFGEPVLITPINPDHIFYEMSRTTVKRNTINWYGETYVENLTTVKIGADVAANTRLVALYRYASPKISIDFSSSYGQMTELGIKVTTSIVNGYNPTFVEI